MDALPIDSTLILACPSCAIDNPVFLAVSMLAGVVPCSYWLLKPYTRNVRTWGVPKIDAADRAGVGRGISCGAYDYFQSDAPSCGCVSLFCVKVCL